MPTLDDAQRIRCFQALGEPNRLAIVDLLTQGPRYGSQLLQRLPLTQPGLSRHLRILREGGVVAETRQGRRVLYRLSHPELVARVLDLVRAVQEPPAANYITQNKSVDQSLKHINETESKGRSKTETGSSPASREEFQDWLR